MDEQLQQLIDRIKQAQNILVAVSSNPTVDQLSAALGLTLALNKLDKHGTAVFSGQVPSTLEFLKPEDTLEKNTDSLRDFIIALDKSKADKLRYKVENDVVRIFITPYRVSLSQKDLKFSQGDFNVDVVICLGVTAQQDLDTAITAHGRILHDATVVSISTEGQGSLGTINWVDPTASSLSEMMVGLADGLDKKLLDNQIATALLTGVVANTDRFRNEKTSPKTMSAAAELMAAGANQQLIASELESTAVVETEPTPANPTDVTTEPPKEDNSEQAVDPGTLEIEHQTDNEPVKTDDDGSQVNVDEDGHLVPLEPAADDAVGEDDATVLEQPASEPNKRQRMDEPPQLADGQLTANTRPESLDPPTEELTLPQVDSPMLAHNETVLSPAEPLAPVEPVVPLAPMMPPAQPVAQPAPQMPLTPPPAAWQPPSVPAPELTLPPADPVQLDVPAAPSALATPVEAGGEDAARKAVEAALQGSPATGNPLDPVVALNAQPLGPELHAPDAAAPVIPQAPMAPPVTNTGFNEPTPGTSPADEALDMPLPSNPFGPGQQQLPPNPLMPAAPPSAFPGAAPQQGNNGQTPPPPVPPPMLPPLQ